MPTVARKRAQMQVQTRTAPRPDLRRLQPKRDTVLLWLVLAAGALFRAWHLGALPIFLDEAGHVDHALRVLDPGRLTFWQLYSDELVNGKFLHVFLYSIALRWVSDPLLGSRLVSVLAGLCTAACCYFVARRLFNARTGPVAALFYAVCPFAFFYDRMALADPILTAAGALTLAGAVALCLAPSWRGAAALALGMGLAPLAKVTGVAIWAVPPIACLFLAGTLWPSATLRNRLLVAYAVAFAIVAAIYVPAYYLCPQKPVTGVLYLTVAADPRGGANSFVAAFGRRLAAAAGWLAIYVGAPFLVSAAAAPFVRRERLRNALFLAAVAAALIVIPAAATSILFSRHVMWSTVPLTIVAAAAAVAAADRVAACFGPETMRRAAAGAGFLALLAAPAILWDYTALAQPAETDLPSGDRSQYIEAWPSGYGAAEAAAFLQAEAANSFTPIHVICPEFGSTSHFGLRILLYRNDRVRIRFTPLHGDAAFAEFRAAAREAPTYVVIDRPVLDPEADLPRLAQMATRVAAFPKPGGRAAVDVYRVTAP